MPTVQTELGKIGIAEHGNDGTPIVFLHGVGSGKSVWSPQLDYFGRITRAVAFDYPGYGESDPAADGTTRDDYAAAILSAMTELGVAKAHICGLSLGGVIAIAMYAIAPHRCESLILADTFALHADGQGIYERSVAASGDLRALAEARVDLLLAQPADPEIRKDVVETMARIDPASYRIGAEAVWLADQRDRVRQIRVPTLVICGSEDKVTPPELSHELVDLIPNARFEEILHSGHLSNLERSADFNRLVDEFLDQVESS
ncbi:MAG TPA: alpha/beta fold hydrolase [Sphingomicrobium sp.]|nr:alpha/beta fold hydrolase [Sphingomicrobium sp.]